MGTINGTITGVSLLKAKGALKTYEVTCNFGAYTGASDTASVTGLGAAILAKNHNGKTHTLKSVMCVGPGYDTAQQAVYFTGASVWAGTISSDDSTGNLSDSTGTELTSATAATGVVLAVTVLES